MAKKPKNTPADEPEAEVVDAEIVEADAVEETLQPVEEPEAQVEEEAIEEEHLDEEASASLSTRVLKGLGLIALGIVIALWGAPKLAPMLPQGLAPVAEFLMPGQAGAKDEIAALRAELEKRIADLESAPKADSISQEAIDQSVATLADKIQPELNAIKDQMAATDGQDIEARLAALETQISGVSAEISAVSERLSLQITENGATLSEEAATKLAGFQATMSGLRAEVAEIAAKNGALSQKVEEIAAASARRVEEAEQQASTQVANTATKKLLSDVSLALDSGLDFQTALDGLLQVTEIPAPADLAAVAASGTPSWADLRRSFPKAAQAALRADTKANAGDGLAGKLGAFLKTQVGTRSLERQEGDTTDAILSRVQDDLSTKNLQSALKEAETLGQDPKAAMANWIADLRALANARAGLDAYTAALGAAN